MRENIEKIRYEKVLFKTPLAIDIYSLEIFKKFGKGAAGSLVVLLFKTEETFVFGSVRLPFWSQLQVIIHSLVTEVEVLITKV